MEWALAEFSARKMVPSKTTEGLLDSSVPESSALTVLWLLGKQSLIRVAIGADLRPRPLRFSLSAHSLGMLCLALVHDLFLLSLCFSFVCVLGGVRSALWGPTYASQRPTSHVFLSHSLPLSLRQGLSLIPEPCRLKSSDWPGDTRSDLPVSTYPVLGL